jgi:hypothetical protein
VGGESVEDDAAMESQDEISQALARKGIDGACRRCGKDEWSLFTREAIVPHIADHVEMAGGTAASIRVCSNCGCIELYNLAMLHR